MKIKIGDSKARRYFANEYDDAGPEMRALFAPEHTNQRSYNPQSHLDSISGACMGGALRRVKPCGTVTKVLIALLALCLFIFALVYRWRGPAATQLDVGSGFEQAVRDFQRAHEEGNHDRWLVATSKCHIPVMESWHPSIEDYVWLSDPLQCGAHSRPALTYTHENRLYFTPLGHQLRAPYLCCFREITRSLENDNDIVYNDTCHSLAGVEGYLSPFELISIECDPKSHLNYTNVHSFIVHNLEEEAALESVARSKLHTEHHYNVVMLGIDTISRLNLYRQLNKSLSVLRDNYDALEFFGYNKVGENTFPNLVPLFTGLTPQQLGEDSVDCWRSVNEEATSDQFLDNCKYLWNFFQEYGYLTYFSEDWPSASTFNYIKQGFRRAPTTFYGRPFTLARDTLINPGGEQGCFMCLYDRSIVELDLDNLRQFIYTHQDERPYFATQWINCPPHDDLNGASSIDTIIERFLVDVQPILQDNNTFLIFHSDHGYRWDPFVSTRHGHYESSLPMLFVAPPRTFIERHPDLYENLKSHRRSLLTPFDMFKTMIDLRDLGRKPAHLEDSQEARFTLKSLLKRPRQLSDETSVEHQSTTTIKPELASDKYDVYIESFTTIPTAQTTIKQIRPKNGISFDQVFRTLSLFARHNRTQLDRNCSDAGIPDNYCVCQEFTSIDVDDPEALGAAYYLVYVHMFKILANRSQCHELNFDSLHAADVFDVRSLKSAVTVAPTESESASSQKTKGSPIESESGKPYDPLELLRSNSWPKKEFNIRVSTSPGGGLFQEVVRSYGDDDCRDAVRLIKKHIADPQVPVAIKHTWVLYMNERCRFIVRSDSLSRLNLYKDQSRCIKAGGTDLKKLCYCKD